MTDASVTDASVTDAVSMKGVIRSGALLTSAEIEGVAPASDWARWLDDGRAPNSQSGNGFRSSWPDDLALLASLGIETVGITLEWSRLQPTQGTIERSEVEHLRTILTGAREAGLEPWACLVDGTQPGWFAVDERGFADDRSRQLLWPRHCDWIGETFGDLVSGWLPIREGIQHAVRNHWMSLGPPGQHDEEAAAKAVQAMTLANGEAWRVLQGSAPVAFYETVRCFVPDTDNTKAEANARHMDNWFRDSWVTAITEGVLDVSGLPSVAVPHLKDAFDAHILQVRPAVQLSGDGSWGPTPTEFLIEGLATAMEAVANHLPAAGLGVAADLAPVADDDAGLEHLEELRTVLAELGAKSWWQTSPIDGWHWERGFDERGGLFTRDRQPRPAADLFT